MNKLTENIPKLTEADIRGWTDPRSFERGQRYYLTGHIINPRREGSTLKARCTGSRPKPYHLEITLDRGGIVKGSCSCPVGAGGHCKHAVALLLTWLYKPETFTTVKELETALSQRSKGELITLIRRMLDRYPELETLLELPIVGETSEPPPVDAEAIRRQAHSAFAGIGYDDWGATYGIAQQLLELVEIGDDYLEIGRWRDAGIIYQAVMAETLENYGVVQDESGYLNEVANRCVDGLEACLVATEDAFRREMLLKALFEVYRWDVDFGGIDMGYKAPGIILELTTQEEKQMIAEWVRSVLPPVESWKLRTYGGFLLQLEEEWLDDEAILRICRETGRRQDLVSRLLTLGRVEEAVAAARESSDYGLLRLADIFVDQDHGEIAERLIRERTQTSRDTRLTGWLKDRALERGDQEEALALAERLFWQRPALQGYQDLRDLAQPVERWKELRGAILARLSEDKNHTLLVEIHLDEGEVGRALTSLKQRQAALRWGRAGDRLAMQVARAAEEELPREAIRLYAEAAERLIAVRGRGNYATAATHLTRVRDIYRRIGEESIWETFIAELREKNRRLPALKDELNKAGL